MANPIIFIPGIEATTLVNTNTFNYNNVWDNFDTILKSVGTPVFTYALQANPGYDADPSTIIRNGHIANFPYAEAIPSIQQKTGAPMFLFGYDWRKSNMENGKRLLEFVAYLKGKLNSGSLKFDFITHSMGGLVFTSYLKQLNNVYDDLGRMVMCAPPFRGSIYPLVHLAIGNAGVNSVFSASDASRKANRTFPSIFELTSWYKDAVIFAANGQEADLLTIDNWQSNIYDDDKALFQSRLDLLKEYRTNGAMDLSQLPDAVKSNIVIIAGEDGKTLNKVLVQSKAPAGNVTNFFDFNQPTG
ncbi:MAG: lipase/acyltransferase domain-containing protein, partial [Bacteroidia bacterium]